MSTGMSILTNGAFLTITGRRPSTMKSNITLDHASNQYPSELLFSLQQGGQKTNASTSSTLEKSGPNEMDNKTTRHSNRHSNYGGNGIRNKSTIIATGYRTNIEDNGLAADRAFNTPRSRPRRETADDNDRIEGNQGRNSEIAPSYSEGDGAFKRLKNNDVSIAEIVKYLYLAPAVGVDVLERESCQWDEALDGKNCIAAVQYCIACDVDKDQDIRKNGLLLDCFFVI